MRTLFFCTVIILHLVPSCARAVDRSPAAAPVSAATRVSPLPERATVVLPTASGPMSFDVELARDDGERARGLMYRDAMASDRGMLFVFDREETHRFWMKNTRLPLDMLFIDARGVIVGIVENAEPYTLTPRHVDSPSQYVLELNGGSCRRFGIQQGSRAQFQGISGHPARSMEENNDSGIRRQDSAHSP